MQQQYTADIAAFVDYFTISRNKSPRTATEYARDLLRFERFIAPAQLRDATTEHIEAFRDSLLTEGRNQPQSVNRKLAAIASFFSWREKKKMLGRENPFGAVDKPKCARPLPKVMSEAEVECLLSARVEHRKAFNAFLQARDRAMMELLYGSGLRRFEVTGLDVLDIDLLAHKVRVRHGKGDKERYSYLSTPAIEALTAYLDLRTSAVSDRSGSALFVSVHGDRISPRQLWAVFKRFREASGLQKHVVPHTMRHSFATHIYRRSRNIRAVQKLLGHSNIGTTERYTHVEDSELAEIYAAAHPRA